MKKLLLLLCLSSLAYADEVAVFSFSGLNTQDNAATLEDSESQDLLNVNIIPGGKGVTKREGYGLHKTLTYSTSSVHGAHYFQDTAGSNIQLWGNDIYIQGSVNGASIVNLATMTVNSTMQCADSAGYAYCLTSSRNTCVRTDGTTSGTSFQGTVPLGTMVTFTPDRMVVAGVSGNESTLYFSQANTPTTFTTGVLDASPFTEVINAPGSRINHIRYACGKLLWWKDTSFGYTVGNNQFDLENVIISPNIGSLDNSSDEYNGHVYFRGQDSHIYDYDCANVTRLSRKITPTVQAAGRRRANSWTQTTQSDWASGTGVPTANFSSTISPGDLVLSSRTSTQFVDTSSTNFVAGTLVNLDTTTVVGSLVLSSTWGASSFLYDSYTTQTTFSNFNNNQAVYFITGSATLQQVTSAELYCTTAGSGGSWTIEIYSDSSGAPGSSLVSGTLNSDNCGASPAYAWAPVTFSSTSLSPSTKYWVYKAAAANNNVGWGRDGGGTFGRGWQNGSGITPFDFKVYLTTSGYFTSGSIVSQTFNVGFSSNSWKIGYPLLSSNYTLNSQSITFETQTSFDGVTFNSLVSQSTGSAITSTPAQYIRYKASFSGSGLATPILADVTISTPIVVSTGGIYLSAVNNASGVTQWSTFGANDQTSGGTIAYYVRASTASFIVTSSTPVWVAQSKNATVNYATGTYMQSRTDWTTTFATATLSLSDFTFNWFEGSALDKAYIKYHNDNVWVAVSSGTSGLNNRILRWDLLNQTWLLDDIGSNGFLVDSGDLYLGSPSAGKVYKFGQGVTTDDAGSINSYWRSKNFTGKDPFVQNTWDQLAFVTKQSSGTYLSVDYRVNGSTTANAYTINLYDATKTILHRGKNLPVINGTFFNVKFGDNSSNPRYEVYGFRAKYTGLPWKPE